MLQRPSLPHTLGPQTPTSPPHNPYPHIPPLKPRKSLPPPPHHMQVVTSTSPFATHKSTGTTLSWCARLAVTLLQCCPNTVCKPDFNANLPHKNLATAPPQRGAQVPPQHASPPMTPTPHAKTPPPQHSTQVPPHHPIAHEPRCDTMQKPHHQPAVTPPCTPLLPLLTSYSSTIIASYLYLFNCNYILLCINVANGVTVT